MACRTNRCGCGTCGSSPCNCSPCGNICSGGCGGNCSSGCNGNYTEVSCGVKTVSRSYLVDGGKYRQVKFANGCCERIARAWVPQTYRGIITNGPQPLGRCVGGNLNNTDSECMDCMNGMFNSGVR